MKILQINNCHYRRGGADIVYFNTADLLQKKGHEIYFFSMSHPNNIFSNFSYYFVPYHDYRKLSFAGKIKKAPAFVYNRDACNRLKSMLEKIKPDVAHLHLFLGGLTPSILIALKEKNIPIVYSVHDYRLLCPAYLFLNSSNIICEMCIDKFYLRCTINRCSENNLFQSCMLSIDAYFRKYVVKPFNYIDCYIFVSNFIRQKHIAFDPGYSQRANLLYNFIPDLDSIRSSEQKGSYFLFYGRLSREKGINTLIESAKQTGIVLKVVGTGPLINSYKSNTSETIQFLGYMNGDELWDLVRKASFVIVPSEWYENNPLTILEAYAYGKPVIGSRIGGIPEIIEEGRTGFLFNAGDKEQLAEILLKADKTTSDEYKIMSNNARNFADDHFHPEIHYQALIKIYEELTLKSY